MLCGFFWGKEYMKTLNSLIKDLGKYFRQSQEIDTNLQEPKQEAAPSSNIDPLPNEFTEEQISLYGKSSSVDIIPIKNNSIGLNWLSGSYKKFLLSIATLMAAFTFNVELQAEEKNEKNQIIKELSEVVLDFSEGHNTLLKVLEKYPAKQREKILKKIKEFYNKNETKKSEVLKHQKNHDQKSLLPAIKELVEEIRGQVEYYDQIGKPSGDAKTKFNKNFELDAKYKSEIQELDQKIKNLKEKISKQESENIKQAEKDIKNKQKAQEIIKESGIDLEKLNKFFNSRPNKSKIETKQNQSKQRKLNYFELQNQRNYEDYGNNSYGSIRSKNHKRKLEDINLDKLDREISGLSLEDEKQNEKAIWFSSFGIDSNYFILSKHDEINFERGSAVNTRKTCKQLFLKDRKDTPHYIFLYSNAKEQIVPIPLGYKISNIDSFNSSPFALVQENDHKQKILFDDQPGVVKVCFTKETIKTDPTDVDKRYQKKLGEYIPPQIDAILQYLYSTQATTNTKEEFIDYIKSKFFYTSDTLTAEYAKNAAWSHKYHEELWLSMAKNCKGLAEVDHLLSARAGIFKPIYKGFLKEPSQQHLNLNDLHGWTNTNSKDPTAMSKRHHWHEKELYLSDEALRDLREFFLLEAEKELKLPAEIISKYLKAENISSIKDPKTALKIFQGYLKDPHYANDNEWQSYFLKFISSAYEKFSKDREANINDNYKFRQVIKYQVEFSRKLWTFLKDVSLSNEGFHNLLQQNNQYKQALMQLVSLQSSDLIDFTVNQLKLEDIISSYQDFDKLAELCDIYKLANEWTRKDLHYFSNSYNFLLENYPELIVKGSKDSKLSNEKIIEIIKKTINENSPGYSERQKNEDIFGESKFFVSSFNKENREKLKALTMLYEYINDDLENNDLDSSLKEKKFDQRSYSKLDNAISGFLDYYELELDISKEYNDKKFFQRLENLSSNYYLRRYSLIAPNNHALFSSFYKNDSAKLINQYTKHQNNLKITRSKVNELNNILYKITKEETVNAKNKLLIYSKLKKLFAKQELSNSKLEEELTRMLKLYGINKESSTIKYNVERLIELRTEVKELQSTSQKMQNLNKIFARVINHFKLTNFKQDLSQEEKNKVIFKFLDQNLNGLTDNHALPNSYQVLLFDKHRKSMFFSFNKETRNKLQELYKLIPSGIDRDSYQDNYAIVKEINDEVCQYFNKHNIEWTKHTIDDDYYFNAVKKVVSNRSKNIRNYIKSDEVRTENIDPYENAISQASNKRSNPNEICPTSILYEDKNQGLISDFTKLIFSTHRNNFTEVKVSLFFNMFYELIKNTNKANTLANQKEVVNDINKIIKTLIFISEQLISIDNSDKSNQQQYEYIKSYLQKHFEEKHKDFLLKYNLENIWQLEYLAGFLGQMSIEERRMLKAESDLKQLEKDLKLFFQKYPAPIKKEIAGKDLHKKLTIQLSNLKDIFAAQYPETVSTSNEIAQLTIFAAQQILATINGNIGYTDVDFRWSAFHDTDTREMISSWNNLAAKYIHKGQYKHIHAFNDEFRFVLSHIFGFRSNTSPKELELRIIAEKLLKGLPQDLIDQSRAELDKNYPEDKEGEKIRKEIYEGEFGNIRLKLLTLKLVSFEFRGVNRSGLSYDNDLTKFLEKHPIHKEEAPKDKKDQAELIKQKKEFHEIEKARISNAIQDIYNQNIFNLNEKFIWLFQVEEKDKALVKDWLNFLKVNAPKYFSQEAYEFTLEIEKLSKEHDIYIPEYYLIKNPKEKIQQFIEEIKKEQINKTKSSRIYQFSADFPAELQDEVENIMAFATKIQKEIPYNPELKNFNDHLKSFIEKYNFRQNKNIENLNELIIDLISLAKQSGIDPAVYASIEDPRIRAIKEWFDSQNDALKMDTGVTELILALFGETDAIVEKRNKNTAGKELNKLIDSIQKANKINIRIPQNNINLYKDFFNNYPLFLLAIFLLATLTRNIGANAIRTRSLGIAAGMLASLPLLTSFNFEAAINHISKQSKVDLKNESYQNFKEKLLKLNEATIEANTEAASQLTLELYQKIWSANPDEKNLFMTLMMIPAYTSNFLLQGLKERFASGFFSGRSLRLNGGSPQEEFNRMVNQLGYLVKKSTNLKRSSFEHQKLLLETLLDFGEYENQTPSSTKTNNDSTVDPQLEQSIDVMVNNIKSFYEIALREHQEAPNKNKKQSKVAQNKKITGERTTNIEGAHKLQPGETFDQRDIDWKKTARSDDIIIKDPELIQDFGAHFIVNASSMLNSPEAQQQFAQRLLNYQIEGKNIDSLALAFNKQEFEVLDLKNGNLYQFSQSLEYILNMIKSGLKQNKEKVNLSENSNQKFTLAMTRASHQKDNEFYNNQISDFIVQATTSTNWPKEDLLALVAKLTYFSHNGYKPYSGPQRDIAAIGFNIQEKQTKDTKSNSPATKTLKEVFALKNLHIN